MPTIRLITKELFKVPDDCVMDIATIEVYNDIDGDRIKLECLVIENESKNKSNQSKKRYYPLSNVVAFGDEIGFLP